MKKKRRFKNGLVCAISSFVFRYNMIRHLISTAILLLFFTGNAMYLNSIYRDLELHQIYLFINEQYCYCKCFFLLTGFSENSIITQTPSELLTKTNTESVSLHCSHNSSSFNVILWYKQPINGEMQLMGYLYRTNVNTEPVFTEKIKLSGNGASNSELTLESLSLNDSAIYYCAAREHGAVGFLHFCTKTLS